jgi:hypothetical protein
VAIRRNTFARDLAGLQTSLRKAVGATSALQVLFSGTHTYLVLATNNAEMRDGTGSALEVGTITTHDGALTLDSFTPASDLALNAAKVPVTGDLAARWGFLQPNQEWRNLNVSPQFDLSAELAASMWRAQTGQAIEGVVDVDIGFLAEVLQVTGPITAGGMTVDASDVQHTLMESQYAGRSVLDPAYDSRQDRLGALAAATFKALNAPSISLAGLAEAFQKAAAGRHVLLWAADPRIEADWTVGGVAGVLAPDGVIVGLVNRGGNKLDPYQSVVAHLTVAAGRRSTKVTVAVTVTNQVASSAPSYANGGLYYPPGEYVGYVALDAPGWADPIQVSGLTDLVAAGLDGGAQVLAGQVKIPSGGSITVRYSFVVNAGHGSLTIEPSARIPPIRWTTSAGSLSDASAHQIRW